MQDVTQQRHAESLIEYQQNYDELTELPNKKLFCKKLNESLKDYKSGTMIAIAFVGIDRFKAINESLGYKVGDIIIKETGKRIKSVLSSRGLVARHGSSFAILVSAIPSLDYLERILDEIKSVLAKKYIVDAEAIYIYNK